MKLIKSSLPLLSAAFFILFVFNGCVSKRKYLEAQSELDDLKKKQQECVSRTNQLTNYNKKLQGFVDSIAIQNKNLYAERNRYRFYFDSLNRETNALRRDIVALQNSYNGLQSRYDNLMKDQLSKSQQYSNALKVKTQELLEKSRLLAERERKMRDLERILRAQDSVLHRVRDVLHVAMSSFNSDEFTVEERDGKVYLLLSEKLLFESGSAQPRDNGKNALSKIAGVMNKIADVTLSVEGHTDNVPIHTDQFPDNWALSAARGTAVVRLLVNDYKVDPKRVIPAGRSEYFPIGSNSTAEGKARNRRTEFVFTPNLDPLYKTLQNR